MCLPRNAPRVARVLSCQIALLLFKKIKFLPLCRHSQKIQKVHFGRGKGGYFNCVSDYVILDTALIWHLKSEKSQIKLALFHFYQENKAYLNWCYTILYLFLFKVTLKVQDVLKSEQDCNYVLNDH